MGLPVGNHTDDFYWCVIIDLNCGWNHSLEGDARLHKIEKAT